MPAWSDCPVCRCVTTNPQAHAAVCWPVNADASVEEGRWWPHNINIPSVEVADTLRLRARNAVHTITTDVVPAMTSYLSNTAPSPEQVASQVRILTIAVRRLSLIARDLLRLAGRALDTTD